MSKRTTGIIERAIFAHRTWILVAASLITLLLGLQITRIRIEAGFEKLIPRKHAYAQTYREYQQEFGGANRLLVAVQAKQGDIFTPEFFQTIQDGRQRGPGRFPPDPGRPGGGSYEHPEGRHRGPLGVQ
jgi:predicted RND superfamily exporter protein